MSLSGAIAALQAHAKTAASLKSSPTWPPESVGGLPASIAYADTGTLHGMSSGWMKGLHEITVEFLFPSTITPQTAQTMTAVIESYPNVLLKDPTLGGTVDSIQADENQPIRYEAGTGKYGGQEVFVLKFFVRVKIQSALT